MIPSCPGMSSEREVAFLKLQEERLSALEKRKAERKEANQSSEQLNEFLRVFHSLKSEVEAELEKLGKLTSDVEKKSHLNSAQTKVNSLQDLLNDALSYLPAYDLRKSQDAVTTIHENIARVQQVILPKKKFAFGKKKNAAANTNITEKKANTDNKFSKYTGDVIYENKSNETLNIPKNEIHKKDVLLKNLTNCTVNLKSTMGTLHCTNCTNCTFFVGPISGSLFLESCNESVYHVTCQQARIHTTHAATFYIHVTSKAIVEDCKGLKFGIRDQFYEGYEDDVAEAGLGETNNWNDVDDFNWLSKDPSPNWSTM